MATCSLHELSCHPAETSQSLLEKTPLTVFTHTVGHDTVAAGSLEQINVQFSLGEMHTLKGDGGTVQEQCVDDDVELYVAIQKSTNCNNEISSDVRHILAQWTNEFHVKHNAVDEVLKILREHGHPELPETANTLLETCRSVDFEERSGVKYIYFNFKDQLLKRLKMYPDTLIKQLDCTDISLNIDGVPLFKSSSHSL